MSDERDEEYSLEVLLERWREAMQDELHTAIPGRVESYDASAQTADVQPMIRRLVPRADGGTLREQLPIVRAVPVVHPRWGSWFVHAPLAAGDFVLLVMCERDLARWRTTGEVSDPVDRRAHHLSHAVAIPGVYPRTRQLGAGSTPADALVIGREGGATIKVRDDGQVHVAGSDQLARSANLDQHLSAIAADLTAIGTAIEGITGPGTLPLTYDTPGKAALDASAPIPTQNARGA